MTMKSILLRVICPVLVLLNTETTHGIILNTLLLTTNTDGNFSHQQLKNKLSGRGVSLQLTTDVVNVNYPFPSLSRIYRHWWNIQLLLLSSAFCVHDGASVWIRGLNLPYICYIESASESINDIIYTYSKDCLYDELVTSSSKDCLESLRSQPTLSTENVLGMVISNLHWRRMIIFFDAKLDSVATSVISELSRKSVQCLMYRLNSNQADEDITNLISHVISLVPVEQRNFLLLCDGVFTRRILTKANELSDRATAIHMMSSWLLLLPDEEFCFVQNLDLYLDNVATVVMPSNRFSCPLETNRCREALVTTLLYEDTSRQWNTVAIVKATDRALQQDPIFPNQHFGFNKKELLVTTNELAPFSMKRVGDSTTTKFEGICMDLLQELATTFNFTIQLTQPGDLEWGRILNGSWTGIVGQLERQEVDMAVAPLTVTQERESAMDFIYPYYYDTGAALYKLPDNRTSKWLTLTKPFEWEVFLGLGAVFLATSFLHCFLDYELLSVKKEEKRVTEIFRNSIWRIVGIFLRHSSDERIHSQPGQVLLSFVWLFSMLVVATYSGNLIAFLTVTKTYPPFRTLAEVADQSQYIWGTGEGSMWTTLFQTSNVSEYQRIWEGILSNNKTKSGVLSPLPSVHYQFVEEGSYLFFFDRDVIAVWAQDNCDLVLLEETFYQITYAVGLPQNSPYGQMFSEKMLQIEQSGLLQVWKAHWWPNASACAGDMQVQSKAIELIDLQSAFYVLGIGVGTAVLALFTERVMRSSIVYIRK